MSQMQAPRKAVMVGPQTDSQNAQKNPFFPEKKTRKRSLIIYTVWRKISIPLSFLLFFLLSHDGASSTESAKLAMSAAKILIETLLETIPFKPNNWKKGPPQAKEYEETPCFVCPYSVSVLLENNPIGRNCAKVVQVGKTEFRENPKE